MSPALLVMTIAAWPFTPEGGSRLGEALIARQTARRAIVAAASECARAAAEVSRARAQALRALLAGQRLEVFDRSGEPDEVAPPARDDDDLPGIARAKTWIYRNGPAGPLRVVETETVVFRGDAVASRRRVTTHEVP